MPNKAQLIEIMAKHLPPSAAIASILDIGGAVKASLAPIRPEWTIRPASLDTSHWDYAPNSVDAVVGYDLWLSPTMLTQVLTVLRSGGRFIVVNPVGTVDQNIVTLLEDHDYIRILVETALSDEGGVLIRGEKSHTTADTQQRITQIAEADPTTLAIDQFKGRYLYLLIVQTPNKPVWKRTPDERIVWHAAVVSSGQSSQWLAFTSLPKAVQFMQTAVLHDTIVGINKIARFKKNVLPTEQQTMVINPRLEEVLDQTIDWIAIDPTLAEAPQE